VPVVNSLQKSRPLSETLKAALGGMERAMKIWFDTEFIEDGRTIDLISIGMVREDGATFYAESAECNHDRASPWVKENVLVHLQGGRFDWSRDEIAHTIVTFAGEKPEFWAYYADYDWVVLCQLYGTMMDLPKGWPMYCRDVKQLCDNMGNPKLPEQSSTEHHALADAKWTKEAWEFLTRNLNRANVPTFSNP
jgi:3'-5' exoribonuclease-like protein